ncbi:hypothetical protein EDB84DRAFT_430853 [Lactarius hengduanensis]|nr:hypothetical protein EDB84DRAFT_430853 [Lactarius hengduanensis]
MRIGPGYSLDPNGQERTDKPLIIECDYNTNCQNLSFDSARDCSYDELRSKECFRFSTRPFKIQWKDDEGEQNDIHDEATLDDAIKFYHSAAENLVTVLVQISLEFNGPSHSPLAGREEQVSFAWGEVSGPQQGDAMTTGSKDAAGSSCASTRSTDEGGTERSILNGSIDEEHNASFRERLLFRTAREREWLRQTQASHQMIPAFDTLSTISSSFSLNTNSPLSDGLPDTDIPPERREYYTGSRSSGPAGDSEYEAPVNQSRSSSSTHELPVPQEVTCCSECDCILDLIKYTCTTCGEKTLTSRATLIAAKGKGKSSEPSSPTQTILARSLGSSGSSSSTVRAGYELCATCFEKSAGSRDVARQNGKGNYVTRSWNGFVISAAGRSLSRTRRRAFAPDVNPSCQGIGTNAESVRSFTLCRTCYSDVHDIHPIHPFLEMTANKPTFETRSYSEISDDTTSDDNVDEPSLKHLGYQCSYCEQDIVGPRFHCVDCEKDVNTCSDCEIAGLFGSPYASNGEHSSSHIMMKIPVPINETQDVSQLTHRRRYSQDSDGATLRLAPDKVEDYTHIHPQGCNSCKEPIIGVRYQCLSCPSKPSSFNLCSDCEVKSYRVHNPMHTFLKIPRPVDMPGPLESELPIIPILYRYPAGPAPGSPSDISGDPEAYLHDLKHSFALCDRHVSRGRIVGRWYRCAFCAKDLCADCEALDTHDSTHAFLVFKAPVDQQVFRQLADIEKPANSPPVWHGNIYHPQHE